jgi:hypothetical protein
MAASGVHREYALRAFDHASRMTANQRADLLLWVDFPRKASAFGARERTDFGSNSLTMAFR